MTTTTPTRSREECTALIVRHRPLMLRVLGRLRRTAECVRHLDVDEAVAAGLIGLWYAARRWDESRCAFSTAAWRAVTGHLFRAAREYGRPPHVSLEQLGRDFPAPVAPQDRHAEYTPADVLQCLPLLLAGDARLLRWLYLDGRSAQDVADALGITKQCVYQKRDRALLRLRGALVIARHPAPAPTPAPTPTPTPTLSVDSPFHADYFNPGEALMKMQDTPADALLTVDAVARRLAVGKRTIWRWVSEGRLPAPLALSASCRRWRSEDITRHLQRLAGSATA